MDKPIIIRQGDQRAVIYHEGGYGFQTYVEGMGWIVDDDNTGLCPSFETMVLQIREAIWGLK